MERPWYFQSGLRDQIIPNITRFMEEGFTRWQRDQCRVLPAPICRSWPVQNRGPWHFREFLSGSWNRRACGNDGPGTASFTFHHEWIFKAGCKSCSTLPRINCGSNCKRRWIFQGGSQFFLAARRSMCHGGKRNRKRPWICRTTSPRYVFRTTLLFVLDAGIKLLEERRPDILYLRWPISSSMPMLREAKKPTSFTGIWTSASGVCRNSGSGCADCRPWNGRQICWKRGTECDLVQDVLINNLVQVRVRLSARSRMLLSAIMESEG